MTTPLELLSAACLDVSNAIIDDRRERIGAAYDADRENRERPEIYRDVAVALKKLGEMGW